MNTETLRPEARALDIDIDDEPLLPRLHPWRLPLALVAVFGPVLFFFGELRAIGDGAPPLILLGLVPVFFGPLISGWREQVGFDRVAGFGGAFGVIAAIYFAMFLGVGFGDAGVDLLVGSLVIGFALSFALAPVAILGGVIGCAIARWRRDDDEGAEAWLL